MITVGMLFGFYTQEAAIASIDAMMMLIALFFVHHRLHIFPSFAAFLGLALALVLLRPRPEDLFGEVNWSVSVFFAGLFIIVGGVGLGGNSTHIGATANLIAVTEAEQSGIEGARITPLAWMRIGIPTTVLGLLLASAIYAAFFDFFAG